MKTPEQIAAQIMGDTETTTMWSDAAGGWVTIESQLAAAIEADRAQRQPEIYIVQNDTGDVVDAFRDADEASAAYQHTASGSEYSIMQETVWEPGEYAEQRIRTLTAAWEESTNWGADEPHRASDYVLSGDDWRTGLDDEEAAEIVRLIEWQEAQK